MKKFRQLIIILLITYGLGQSAEWITSSPVFQIAFPQLIVLQDFHWEDFAFKIRSDSKREDRITLINISNGTRSDIADQINIINRFNPRVIGVDVVFNCKDGIREIENCPQLLDTTGTRLLHESIRSSSNIVLATILLFKSESAKNNVFQIDSLEYSDPEFKNFSCNGYSSFPYTAVDTLNVPMIRSFLPSIRNDETNVNSFSVEIAFLYDSIKTTRFLQRRSQREINEQVEEFINFRGNVGTYYHSLFGRIIVKGSHFDVLDYDDLLENRFDKEILHNRIVLLGELGS